MGKDTRKRAAQGAPFDPDRKRLELAGEDWKICRLCGVGLSGRRTSYCSDKCSDEWLIRSDPGFARRKVAARDLGICSTCGLDTDRLYRFWARRKWGSKVHNAWTRMHRESLGRGPGARATIWVDGRWLGGYWDMDHIKPVILGGGGCGLDNLRTLCIPCHKKETAKLAARRARDRTILPGSQMELWR